MNEPTVEEIRQIVLAEYKYWNEAGDSVFLQALGAIGAAANILAAIDGHRAPWHPQLTGLPWTLDCGCSADANDNRTWCAKHQPKSS